MKHLFLDTNIVIDFFAGRQPFAYDAAILFDMASKKQLHLYVSALSFNNCYYVLKQAGSHKKTIELLKQLHEWVHTIEVDAQNIHKALHSEFKDFEDAVQFYSAHSQNKIQGIITRNQKDFKPSVLPVFSPREALAAISSAVNTA